MFSLHGCTETEEAAGAKGQGGYVRCFRCTAVQELRKQQARRLKAVTSGMFVTSVHRQSTVSVLMQGEQHCKGSNSIRRNKRRQHHKRGQHHKRKQH